MKRIHSLGETKDSVKYKCWYYLYLRARAGMTEPATADDIALWSNTRVMSVYVSVVKWRSPGWRRILLRRTHSGQLGYILGKKGLKWLVWAGSHLELAGNWQAEVEDNMKQVIERRRLFREELERRHQERISRAA